MNRLRAAAWIVVWAMGVALGAGVARGGEVTVIGTRWQDPALGEGAMPPEPPPLPEGFVPPQGGEIVSGESPEAAASLSTPDEAAPTAVPRVFAFTKWPLHSDWYARFDYFSWRERYGGQELLNEHGTIYNVGYSRTNGAKRVRLEFFTGNISYGSSDKVYPLFPAESTTTYLGVRGEFELLWDLNLHGWPAVTCFGGIGTRYWIRDIKDGEFPDTGQRWAGHQEDWFVLYPYLGMEKRWLLKSGDELFASGRLGCTVFTTEHLSITNAATLYPKPSLTGQIECGLRHEFFFMSAFFEGMAWQASPEEGGRLQPTTETYTTGLRLGLTY